MPPRQPPRLGPRAPRKAALRPSRQRSLLSETLTLYFSISDLEALAVRRSVTDFSGEEEEEEEAEEEEEEKKNEADDGGDAKVR
ncbi:hypothetical protein DEO72_LG7g773 [Vigna unguiculata]|uniref:Uncharacterized protein n=1 Tax=Vigna unguiculata TaxID=3917 RepID=A0A4D6MG71_VIGUN|nr:hypothetical protein DEO72_LG7g773 [Vigna unguiculata]